MNVPVLTLPYPFIFSLWCFYFENLSLNIRFKHGYYHVIPQNLNLILINLYFCYECGNHNVWFLPRREKEKYIFVH